MVQCLELESYRNLVHQTPPALVIFDDPLLEQELSAWLGPLHQTEFSGETPSLALVEPGLGPTRLERWLASGVNDFVEWPTSEAIARARVQNQIKLFEALCLREKVIRDELTGVFSRRYLFESMRQHVNQYSRPGPPVLSCLMIDVDHFKRINDLLGHLEGDVVLRKVATSIYSMTRKGDIVARFGGEEFVVMLPSTDPDGAELVAEKLRAAVESACRDPQVTISIGVSWYRAPEPEFPSILKDEETMELLLRRADEALYRAKSEGRNRVSLMRESPEDERRGHQRMPLEAVVEFSLPSGVGLRKSADLSLGGVRVHDAPELQVGDRVHMSIHLAGTKLEATGTVAWTQSTRGVEDSCGITFETFGRRSRELLARHLGHASILRGEPRTRR
ncbi:MAG: diguanylate cyclase [Candidatus Eremiobacteraeota bacterium]|nr:diguanylate cyclase [Candidatus Eremiobacteraeota bacterium]